MECPFCSCHIKVNHVFCEHCGKEIQLVPLYEPEIEESMKESLSDLIQEVSDEVAQNNHNDTQDSHDISIQSESEVLPKSSSKHKIWVEIGFLVTGILALVVIISVVYNIFLYHSYDYQIRQATAYYNKDTADNYIKAMDHAVRASEIAVNSSDAKMLLASIYLKLEQTDDATKMLNQIIENDDSYMNAYDKLIELYEQQGKYAEINRILLHCSNESIVEKFYEYISIPPEFSIKEGEYDDIVSLKLISGCSGNIYYTLDGTEPTSESIIYNSPIRLEDGEHTITAVCINRFGQKSDFITRRYTIKLIEPPEPDINSESGDYSSPIMIEAQYHQDDEVFYTTDGSEPTKDSTPYISPIPMPLGRSTFKFILYDENGIASNVVTREFNLTLDAAMSLDEAYIILKQSLIIKGDILDHEGSVSNMDMKKEFECTSAFTQNGQIFYLMFEYLTAPDGTRSKSGNVYAMNVYTKELYRATINYEGYYAVSAF